MLKTFLNEELEFEKMRVSKLSGQLDKYPDVNLSHSMGADGFVSFYTRDCLTGRRAYIRRTEPEVLRKIAYGRYLRAGISIMTGNLRAIERLLKTFAAYDHDSILASLPESYRLAITELSGLRRKTVIQSESPKKREELKVVVSNGLLVRSKGELAIAEGLLAFDLEYRYEMELKLLKTHVEHDGYVWTETVTFYPDFTIFLKDGSVIYWEHCGLFDQTNYRQQQFEKFKTYYDNGIYPPKNLIITMDGAGKPINNMEIRRIIKNLILPLC